MIKLGVNVDHVATLRQARGTQYPCPVEAAKVVQEAGAYNVTCHLREDRRHIQDQDIYRVSEEIDLPLNFEMAARDEMFKIAYDIKPHTVTLVPEKREELTTEQGLNVLSLDSASQIWIKKLIDAGSRVSLFIDANKESIDACINLGISEVEFHTGFYADSEDSEQIKSEFDKIVSAVNYANEKNITCHLGHGLNQDNIKSFKSLPVESMQIGHALISDSVFNGLEATVKKYLSLLQ